MANIVEFCGNVIEVKLLALPLGAYYAECAVLRGKGLTTRQWRRFRRGVKRRTRRLGMNWNQEVVK